MRTSISGGAAISERSKMGHGLADVVIARCRPLSWEVDVCHLTNGSEGCGVHRTGRT